MTCITFVNSGLNSTLTYIRGKIEPNITEEFDYYSVSNVIKSILDICAVQRPDGNKNEGLPCYSFSPHPFNLRICYHP